VKSFIAVLLKKPTQFSKFGSIAEITIVDFPENQQVISTVEMNEHDKYFKPNSAHYTFFPLDIFILQ
jgi:predicted glycosyltransferase